MSKKDGAETTRSGDRGERVSRPESGPVGSVLVVGAGVAGLSCARALADAGASPVVLDKARGVGGRCATRRFSEQPVDFGVLFLHGSEPSFLAAIERLPEASRLEPWPARVEGKGPPCAPRAFEPGERRFALREGLTSFPKSLAEGIDLRLSHRVEAIDLSDGAFAVRVEDGSRWQADTLVLALPVEQARALLAPLRQRDDAEAVGSALALLEMTSTEPCLTLVAGYGLDAGVPSWDVLHPDHSNVLAVVSQDSRKRRDKNAHVFVLQSTPAYARRRLEAEPDVWSSELLDEAERLMGSWARAPRFTHPHRWRFARMPSAGLAEPLAVTLPGGATLGIAGEAFGFGGGVENAYLSGRALAKRLLARPPAGSR